MCTTNCIGKSGSFGVTFNIHFGGKLWNHRVWEYIKPIINHRNVIWKNYHNLFYSLPRDKSKVIFKNVWPIDFRNGWTFYPTQQFSKEKYMKT